jgi:FAD/FMN-containing dehydrogenase
LNFTELLHGNLWNRLIPDRAPQVLVRVNDEQDVIAAVLFARANKLKVVVRGGTQLVPAYPAKRRHPD